MLYQVLLYTRSVVFLVVGFSTAALVSVALLMSFWAPQRFHWWLCVTWCRFAMWLLRVICRIYVEVEGKENIPVEASVIMLKHTSTLETFWHVTLFPQTVWVLKREMTWIPFIGWAISLALDPIAIDRSSGRSAVKQVIEQGKEKLARGIWVSVFPEGTRMPPGETRKYGVSGAALARDAGVKIVPVAHNAGDLWLRHSLIKKPGVFRVRVGPPIDPVGRPPKETNLLVQEWIEGRMVEISHVYQEKDMQSSRMH